MKDLDLIRMQLEAELFDMRCQTASMVIVLLIIVGVILYAL